MTYLLTHSLTGVKCRATSVAKNLPFPFEVSHTCPVGLHKVVTFVTFIIEVFTFTFKINPHNQVAPNKWQRLKANPSGSGADPLHIIDRFLPPSNLFSKSILLKILVVPIICILVCYVPTNAWTLMRHFNLLWTILPRATIWGWIIQCWDHFGPGAGCTLDNRTLGFAFSGWTCEHIQHICCLLVSE